MCSSRYALALALTASVFTPAWGQTATPGQGDLLDALFRESGLEARVGFYPQLADELIEAFRKDMKEEELALFEEAMQAGLDVDAMRADARATLARRLYPDSAAAALVWLRTPLGRRMVTLEVASAEGKFQDILDLFADTDWSTPEGQHRLALAVGMIQTTGSAGLLLGMLMARLEGAMRAAMWALGEPDEEEVIEGMKGIWVEFEEDWGAIALATALHAYREASPGDLEAYLAFLRTDVGQWYVAATSEATLDAHAKARERAETVAQALVGSE